MNDKMAIKKLPILDYNVFFHMQLSQYVIAEDVDT